MTGNLILDSIPEDESARLLENSEKVLLERGARLTRPGEPVRLIHFPLDAVVSHYQILKDGRTAEVALTGSEGMIGEGAALVLRDSEYFSEVVIEGKAYRVKAPEFRRFAKASPGCRRVIFEYLNEHIDRASRRVVCNNHHTVEERLCLWLLMIRDRSPLETLPFTQEQVSFFLGVHRPSITLAMQELKEKRVVDYGRGEVNILDPRRLTELACSCYPSLTVDTRSQLGDD